jgi:muramoyltetrapeptide carboxypeptidase
MGFSDNTILHTAFRVECGLATLYGPGLLTDWAEHPRMPNESLRTALHLMTSTEPLGYIASPDWWTDEFLDWESGEDIARERNRRVNPGHTWIRGGTAEGLTIGGCLETLQHMRGTPWWPNFNGAILCLETSEECPDPLSFDAMLGDYASMGVLDSIAGLLVARPYGFNAEQHRQFLDLLTERVSSYEFPVVANMDFGHTTPMITMPLGVTCRIDSDRREVAVVEAFARR